MIKRMLIDDTQPEETRVVVINGNKLEDVEFESSSRKQIKGNIYLAKVMRIEPSLQAAFVDYGGNRHGFLAFGEIHPDYYHIDEAALSAMEKEIDQMIENKKQAARERELERARLRQERALKRARRLEQEAAEQARENDGAGSDASRDEQTNVAAENTQKDVAAENTQADVAENIPVTDKEQSLEAVNGEALPAPEEAKPARRRGRRPKARKTDAAAAAESEEKKNEKVKTLAEDTGCEEDVIKESEEREGFREETEFRRRGEENANDDEIAVDDDDDDEYDYEVQKKLLLLRKLFHQSKIQDVIKEGQILLVQVVKEERGNKGAALTTYLSLAGRYCVLMPNRIKSGGVSRKITNAADRKRLKNIIRELPMPSDMSLIVRTAGEDKTKADIVRDYNYLIRTWNQIRLGSLRAAAPALIYEEGNLIKRALRDMFTKEIAEIIIDGDKAFQAARDFMKILSPHSMKKLKCCKADEIPLFQRFQVEAQIDKLHDTNVQLESGGYLVINPTEALVSIDVNSGRATKEKDLEETALKTNMEAADEIAKQLRMRNLAGLVVIDFIDMDDPKNNQAIEKRMKEAMKKDRARVQIGKMSCFGLLEISRQRMHSSFFESNYHICPYCHGRGIIRTVESGAVSILRSIEEEAVKGRSSQITVFVPRDVAIYLLNQKRGDLVETEQRYKVRIIIAADENIRNVSDFKIERVRAAKTTEQTPTRGEETSRTEQSVAEKQAGNNTDEKNDEENADNGANEQRRGRTRGRFDRRRNGRRRRDDRQEDNNEEKQTREEPVILYNSHDGAPETASPATEEKQPEKRKVAWWKKLING